MHRAESARNRTLLTRRAAAVAATAGSLLTAAAFGAAPASAAPSRAASTAVTRPDVAVPSIAAKGGYLLNASTGRTAYAKDADTRRSTGSTTKIMTALVVLDQPNLDLNRQVPIVMAYSDYIVAKGASSAHLIVGDKLTVRQLLYAMLLPSGCDAAYALADTFGTGATRADRVASFIAQMNATAQSLGMTNTHFDSFDGIGNGANYSTPRDLTTLASVALRSPVFRQVVGTRSTQQKVLTKTGGYRYMSWANTNTLLGYRGTFGVKTGSGPDAGYCLVFAATLDGRTEIGAVLDAPSEAQRTKDVEALINYGFAS